MIVITAEDGRHHGNPSCHFLAEYSATYITLHDISGGGSLHAGRIPLLRMRHGILFQNICRYEQPSDIDLDNIHDSEKSGTAGADSQWY